MVRLFFKYTYISTGTYQLFQSIGWFIRISCDLLDAYIGIPDCNGYRALCWKLLLGYLGSKKQDWPNILQKKRQLYKQFIST